MTKERPVNLNLASIHFPVPAVVSVLHRATGVLLFLFIPFILWMLWYSLSSVAHFTHLASLVEKLWVRMVMWIFFSALIYHVIAGVRHLLLDIHIGESLTGGRIGSWLVLFISIMLIALAALCILFGFNKFIF